MERLQVVTLIHAALQAYRQHFPQVLRVITLPALAHAVVLYVWYHAAGPNKPLAIMLSVAQVLLLALAAISCHRIILLGSESVPRFGASGTATRDWRFIGIAAALYILTVVAMYLVTLLINVAVFTPLGFAGVDATEVFGAGQVLVYLIVLPGLYVVSRLAICLPAVAIDRSLGPRQAWRMTQGNGLRLLILISLLPWLLQFARRHLAWTFSTPADAVVVANLLLWLLLPFQVAVVSLCYKHLSQRST